MNTYLLDTHVALWVFADDRRLGKRARATLDNATMHTFVSAASIWEIAIKVAAGKLRLRRGQRVVDIVDAIGCFPLSITVAHAAASCDVSAAHPDPFDRLLLAQAKLEHLILVTADEALEGFGVPLLDATE